MEIEFNTPLIKGKMRNISTSIPLVKFAAFKHLKGENQALVANYFAQKNNLAYCDVFNLLWILNATITYTYPDFNTIEIFENTIEAFQAGINRLKRCNEQKAKQN